MNTEKQIENIQNFTLHRPYILTIVNHGKPQKSETSSEEYLVQLMNMPVSKASIFGDDVWDFNADQPQAARNVRGSKLKVNFNLYDNIPKFVQTELKTLFFYILLSPLSFRNEKKTKRLAKGKLKPNTLIGVFKSGMRFIDKVFDVAILEYGREYVHQEIKSLAEISTYEFEVAARSYTYNFDSTLLNFFTYLRHPLSSKEVLDGAISNFDLKSRIKPKGQVVNAESKIIPNSIFEKLSALSSLLIVDFLQELEEEVQDQNSLKQLKYRGSIWSRECGVNQSSFNEYRVLRLRYKNYSESYIRENYPVPDWIFEYGDNTEKSFMAFNKMELLCRARFMREPLRKHINLVYQACLYIVGQFTGMRPSEMSEIVVKDEQCLKKEDGHWLICSQVKKHRESYNGLFDEKWLAIPIIRDAIRAASIINTLKNNPYLCANADTVASCETPQAMGSSGIKHQINNLIDFFFGSEKVKSLAFYPYMMRHTLAYQLFRAELGLPFISFQLKHFITGIDRYTSKGGVSEDTLGYGDIAQQLSKNGRYSKNIRHQAELESIKATMDPDGNYAGVKAAEHKQHMSSLFNGYMASGYTKEEVFEAMVHQGIAIVNVGQGYCYGGQVEDFNDSLPCIGGLRCNPVRCGNAIVTKQNAPHWRGIYSQNMANLNNPAYSHVQEEIKAAIEEAKLVLTHLGEDVEL
ncbi:MAG TPA: site-specific integrase [Methylophaga aminisulfidivorans]|uniref:Site-specific integrase n=3 Tax=root TaxID=1 RepID=A0A7C1ZQ96_9GAMM|nr:site-specific integrase [Methylophaga aminisulfidivorans]